MSILQCHPLESNTDNSNVLLLSRCCQEAAKVYQR